MTEQEAADVVTLINHLMSIPDLGPTPPEVAKALYRLGRSHGRLLAARRPSSIPEPEPTKRRIAYVFAAELLRKAAGELLARIGEGEGSMCFEVRRIADALERRATGRRKKS